MGSSNHNHNCSRLREATHLPTLLGEGQLKFRVDAVSLGLFVGCCIVFFAISEMKKMVGIVLRQAPLQQHLCCFWIDLGKSAGSSMYVQWCKNKGDLQLEIR